MFTKTAEFYDAIYEWKDYKKEAADLHALIKERKPKAKTLLDVACGTGMHLKEFARRYDVTGVDLEEAMLAVAAKRVPKATLVQGDLKNFAVGRQFDVVTCLFSSIGYAETPNGLRSAIAAMESHVLPGGLLIVEPWLQPEAWIGGQVQALFVDKPGLKVARIGLSRIESRVSVLEFDYLIGTPAGVHHEKEVHRLGLFSTQEQLEILESHGLTVEFKPDWPGRRGLFISQKPLGTEPAETTFDA